MRRAATLLASIGFFGCAGKYHAAPVAPANPADGPDGAASAGDVRGVRAAALPYAIVDGHTGRAVPEAEFWQALGKARAVCAGEDHPNPHHHWVQLAIVEHLRDARGDGRGPARALGLEMVQTPFQGVLTDYQGKLIDEAAFLSRSGWADRWGYDFALYRPMLEAARDAGWSLHALNAPRELVKRVSRVGLQGLDATERAQLPDLELADARHKAWWDGVMAEMGGDHGHGASDGAPPPGMPSPENMYAAQVVWDESMAQSASKWLGLGGTAIVILAGNGHCHDSAIVGRLRRRGVTDVVSVRPIIDDGEGNVAQALIEKHNDYLFVMTMPDHGAAGAAPAPPAP